MYFTLCVSHKKNDRNNILHMYSDILKMHTQLMRYDKQMGVW